MSCARASLVALIGIVAGMGLAGCADDQPKGPTATQRVTERFGRELLEAHDNAPLAGNATVLRLLEKYHDPSATSARGDVWAIDGRRARSGGANEQTWALNVNGIEADEAPRRYRLHEGDVVQWDLRDWYITLDVRATVGAFPETFSRGIFGKRFPVTVECEKPASAPCRRVTRALHDAGVATDGSRPPGGRPPKLLPQRAKVLVGRWEHWRKRPWPRRIDDGPRYSGVFARFGPDAQSLRLLDWDGHRVRIEGPGTGLVAAMRPTEEDLTWLITGVDDKGVARAAQALESEGLRDAFAAAVTADGVEKLPLPAPPAPEFVPAGDVDVKPFKRPIAEAPPLNHAGPPSRRFLIDDEIRGGGKRAALGQTVVVNYVGYVYSDGRWRRYESTYGPRGRPLAFTIRSGTLIDGFLRGVRGMRVGGRRTVTVPPHLGYGKIGFPPKVGPAETLAFVIDLEAAPDKGTSK